MADAGEKLHVLIVGAGSIGERHLRCFLNTGKTRCSVVEPRQERAAELQSRYQIERVYGRFEDAAPNDFAAAVICTPPVMHIPMAQRLVDAGCHVLLEKPLSNSMAGVRELIDASRRHGIVVGVAYVWRAIPALQHVKRLVEAGEVGEVLSVFVKSNQQFSRYRPDYNRIYFASKELGGGAILDASSHTLSYVEWLLGREREVSCVYDTLGYDDIETEDIALMTLRFENRRTLVQLHHNLFQKDNATRLEVIGSAGTIRWDYQSTKVGICKSEDTGWTETAFPAERDDYFVAEAENFLAAIRGEAEVLTPLEDAAQTLRVCLAAKQSSEEKRVVCLDYE